MHGAGIRLVPAALAAAALAACSPGSKADPRGVTVEIAPAWAAVAVSGTIAFTAWVGGTADGAVTWAVEPAGCGSVEPTGVFTAPATPSTCLVRATSHADPARSDGAAITVVPAAGTGLCGAAAGQLFPPAAPWNVPIDAAPLDAESSTIVGYLAANHTAGARFQLTFDFNVLYADAATAKRAFTPTGDFFSPDCDPAPVPLPAGGRLESESDYACTTGGDCHLTVVAPSECRLYEMWRADLDGGTASGTFRGGCLAVWDVAAAPPATLRGDHCTSADAAGLPIVPLVFTADEVAAGSIEHALRFILPNALIRRFVYVRPATHSTSATRGPAAAPPYGIRMRLKAATNLSGLSPGARVIARALQRYGMILADGGNVTFTAATDDLTVNKWPDVGVDAQSLKGLAWSDFEVVDSGTRLDGSSGDCTRTPLTL